MHFFRLFSQISEKVLFTHAQVSTANFCGRGSVPKFVKLPARAVSRPVQHAGDQAAFAERRLRKLARQLDELRRQKPGSPGPWPHFLRNLWLKAQSRAAACKLHFSCHNLSEVRDTALKQADALHQTSQFDAVTRWRQKIQAVFISSKRESFLWKCRKYKASHLF